MLYVHVIPSTNCVQLSYCKVMLLGLLGFSNQSHQVSHGMYFQMACSTVLFTVSIPRDHSRFFIYYLLPSHLLKYYVTVRYKLPLPPPPGRYPSLSHCQAVLLELLKC